MFSLHDSLLLFRHEHELGQLSGMYGRAARKRRDRRAGDGEERVKLIANGYWRDVWLLNKAAARFPLDVDEEITVLKTLRYRHDFTDRNYDRHRKDALASERLSGSEHVVDIFACALDQVGVMEMVRGRAPHGDG